MSRVEVFLDDTPGETRGIVLRDGRPEHLLIHRDDDPPAHRLGARSVGRVLAVEPTLKGAFVALPGTDLAGFLAGRTDGLTEGAAVEVEVLAEPRGGKGPQLRAIGPASGPPRPVAAGPDARALLSQLAPGATAVEGVAAIDAGLQAQEEGLAASLAVDSLGLDLMVERTRAMICVDLDLLPTAPGRGRQARDKANRAGLAEAARLIRLKRWGGLTAIDLVGTGHDGEAILSWARQAFGADPTIGFGPVNRFGVLMLSLPWRQKPLEEVLLDSAGRVLSRARVQDHVRALRRELLSDPTTACVTLSCDPADAALAANWVAALGPRARLAADPAMAGGRSEIRKD